MQTGTEVGRAIAGVGIKIIHLRLGGPAVHRHGGCQLGVDRVPIPVLTSIKIRVMSKVATVGPSLRARSKAGRPDNVRHVLRWWIHVLANGVMCADPFGRSSCGGKRHCEHQKHEYAEVRLLHLDG